MASSPITHNEEQGMFLARMMSGIMNRIGFSRLTSFGGRRDYNKIFGWDDTLSPAGMLQMYNRGGIAKRVVDSYPDAVWSRPPQLWAEGDDAWTRAWEEFTNIQFPVAGTNSAPLDLWQALHRADKLAGLGHYAILLIGTDRPGLETPLTRAERITYLQPYGEYSVKIERYVTDPTDPRFGQPLIYRVSPQNPGEITSTRGGFGDSKTGAVRSSFRVHASRVIHIAKGCLEDEVFGQPSMAPVWDYLTDLRKVVGSSSESYWINANRGLQADIDKEMQLSAADQAALQDEIEEFFNGFRRFIRTKGVKMNPLENDIADPRSPFDVLVTLISGTSGIPKRILLGSEAGQLASTQDKGNWAERVEEHRALTTEPRILVPFVRKVINLGLLPAPGAGSKVKVLWEDAYRMNPLERGQTSAQTGRVLSYITKLAESKDEETRNLLSRREKRALLGLSTDNRVLEDDPQP